MWLTTRGFSATAEDGKSGPQLRVTPAPCCRRSKRNGCLAINTQSGLWKCFGCGEKGNWVGLARRAGDPLPDPYEDALPVDMSAYDHIRSKLRRRVTGGHHAAVLTYCVGERLIRPETLDAWRVSTAGPEVLRFPIYAWQGAWVMATARMRRVLGREGASGALDWFEVKGGPTCLAMGNHLLGVEPLTWKAGRPSWALEWLDPSRHTPEAATRLESPFPAVRRVLVVEGQWDAMTAWQLGIPNVLSLPNGASAVDVANLLRYVPEDAEVWVGTDMDEAGDKAAEAFFAQLGGRARRLMLPVKDLNDWLKAKPDLTPEDVIATAEGRADRLGLSSHFVDMLGEDEDDGASEIITETPWPRLTRRLDGGFRAGHTTGVLAPSGVGKTTFANNIVCHAAERGVTCGVIQLESSRPEVRTKLRSQLVGWTEAADEKLKTLFKRILLADLEGKEVKWRQTIERFEEMARAGARLLVMDNWDYISHSHDDKLKAYAAFQEICKTWQAHGIVIWQPRKVDRATAVNSGDQKGMSQAFQDADVYLTMNKHGLARRIDVEKARVDETDEELSTLWLRYDATSKCLHETASQADIQTHTGGPEPL